MQTPEGSGPHVSTLYRYPVKGLTPERLDRVTLEPGETLPFDRAYAIENGPGRFDPDAPRHLPKINFVMLMRDERLATLRSRFDDSTHTLTISRGGKPVVSGQLSTPLGRQLIEQFIAAYMKAELRGAPKIVRAPGHSFSDVAAKCVHIVNLASVRELGRVIGRKVDPLRFRANVYLDGLAPWAELNWIDKAIGIGPARVQAFARTRRCAAPDVDPETGARDMAIPATLARTWAHQDFGIYATVIAGGVIAAGAVVTVPESG
ncbi:MAG: MOSC domain-containing protein [Hyphomicrobiaceae bacterium]|nr:MOSC domain-containing protein [Hyphomicrobiaceae bacterium]